MREGFEKLTFLKKAHLQIRSDEESLSEAFEWFEQLNQPPITPEKIWMVVCKTAFYEGLTNVMRHAHRNLSKNTPIDIKVTIEIKTKTIKIRIWDRGPGFDLEDKIEEMAKTSSPDRECGRGLLMMRELGDKLSYTQTDDNRNCLLFVKHYENDVGELVVKRN